MNVRDPGFFDLSQFTPAELLAAMEEARPELDAADRADACLFTLQTAEAELDEEDDHPTATVVRNVR